MTREQRTAARRLMQVVVIVALLFAGFGVSRLVDGLRADNVTESSKVAQIEGTLAETCTASTVAMLREADLLAECGLAQRGELADAIDSSALPKPDAEPTDVEPNVVDDDSADTPPLTVSDDQVAEQVRLYFVRNPLPTSEQYATTIRRSVAQYLTLNPPAPGRPPTQGEVRVAARDVLLANPPADGTPGANGTNGTNGTDGANGTDGRAVASATLDGCDVVFTYSDGSTDRVGPLCGADGTDGTNGDPGPPGVVDVVDECDPGEDDEIIDVDASYVAERQAVIVSCKTRPRALLGN